MVRGELDVVFLVGAKDLRVHATGVDYRNRYLERRELQSKSRAHGLHSMLGPRVHLGGKRHLFRPHSPKGPEKGGRE